MYQRRVDLLHLHQRPSASVTALRPGSFEKQCAVTLDVLPAVVLGEAEIQRPSAIAGGNPARPRAESVYQPRKLRQAWRSQDLKRLAGFDSSGVSGSRMLLGGRHSSILEQRQNYNQV